MEEEGSTVVMNLDKIQDENTALKKKIVDLELYKKETQIEIDYMNQHGMVDKEEIEESKRIIDELHNEINSLTKQNQEIKQELRKINLLLQHDQIDIQRLIKRNCQFIIQELETHEAKSVEEKVLPKDDNHTTKAYTQDKHEMKAYTQDKHEMKAYTQDKHEMKAYTQDKHEMKAYTQDKHEMKAYSQDKHEMKAYTQDKHEMKAYTQDKHEMKAYSQDEHEVKAYTQDKHEMKACSQDEHEVKAYSQENEINDSKILMILKWLLGDKYVNASENIIKKVKQIIGYFEKWRETGQKTT
ncbi:uncharacterized protein [Antedon mediterranea]|uniref:uncharacterized protein n=1 Tax=Antedon mediterranea TaxID=105859 RepID=UPI003AF8D890